MDTQIVNSEKPTVSIDSLNVGQTFLTDDGMNDVCINIGYDHQNNIWEYIIVGECPEVCWTDKEDFQVRPVKSKLIVEV